MPNSIYSPYDMRFNNPAFSQQSGQMGSFGANQLGFTSGTGTGGVSSGLPNYNASPTPTSGQGPYGLVPGTIPIPPSTFQQTVGVAPGLGNTTQLTNNIMSELQGDINPQALKNMQDAAASYGISSGMPGSNAIPGTLAFNKNLRNIGLDTLAVQRQGQQDYLSALQGIGGTQTPQGLAAEIAAHNAQLRAAPDPQAAAQQQLANYWAALNALRGPGGGTGQGLSPAGGTGQNAGSGALGFGFGTLGQQGGAGTLAGGIPPTTSTASSFYPGTDVSGFPSLDSILGQPNYNYGSTDFGTPSVPFAPPTGLDASNPDFWNIGTTYDQTASPDLGGSPYFDESAFYGGF